MASSETVAPRTTTTTTTPQEERPVVGEDVVVVVQHPPQQQQQDEVNDETKWTSSSIILNVVDDISVTPRTSSAVNIAPYIGRPRIGTRAKKVPEKRMYLADFTDYCTQYRVDAMMPVIVRACREDGFNAFSKGYEKDRNRLRIFCSRSKFHRSVKRLAPKTKSGAATAEADHDEDSDEDDDDDSIGDNRDVHTAAGASAAADSPPPPIDRRKILRTTRPLCREDRCTFQLPLFWDDNVKLWYLLENGAGCLHHRGHRRKLPKDITFRTQPPDMGPVLQAFSRFDQLPTATLPLPTPGQLLTIQATHMDRRSRVMDDLMPSFTRIANLCTNAGSYYICEEWLKALEKVLVDMKSSVEGATAGSSTTAATGGSDVVAEVVAVSSSGESRREDPQPTDDAAAAAATAAAASATVAAATAAVLTEPLLAVEAPPLPLRRNRRSSNDDDDVRSPPPSPATKRPRRGKTAKEAAPQPATSVPLNAGTAATSATTMTTDGIMDHSFFSFYNSLYGAPPPGAGSGFL